MFGIDEDCLASIKNGSLFYLNPIVGSSPILVYAACSLQLKRRSEYDYELAAIRTIQEGQQDLDLPAGINGVDELEGVFELLFGLILMMSLGVVVGLLNRKE